MANALRLAQGALRELRIHLCQTTAASRGVREWIEQDYVTLKKANLDFPILIRECSGISPKIWARYARNRCDGNQHECGKSRVPQEAKGS